MEVIRQATQTGADVINLALPLIWNKIKNLEYLIYKRGRFSIRRQIADLQARPKANFNGGGECLASSALLQYL